MWSSAVTPNTGSTAVKFPMEQMDMNLSQLLDEIDYSDKYCDDIYEYRRVTVPREMVPTLPTGRTMEEFFCGTSVLSSGAPAGRATNKNNLKHIQNT